MRNYNVKADIAVIGGGPAGLSAAISAARQGKRVILLEKNGYLGGNATLGLPLLGFLDVDGRRIVGGIADEYVRRLRERGQSHGHRTCPKHNSVTNIDPEGFKILAIEMCREARVDIILHTETVEVEKEENRIKRVKLYGKGNLVCVDADIFIDCTGDGDVAYLAGCSFESGQADTGVLQPPTVMFTLENVDTERVYDYIEDHPDEMTYSATIDHRPGYDAPYFRADLNHVFVGLRQIFKRLKAEGKLPVKRETLIYIKSFKDGEVYVNSTRMLNTDATDIFDLTRAELDGQIECNELAKVLRENVPGFENSFISHIAPFLGVRETRRFKGIYRLTADEVLRGEIPSDTIGLAGYKIDIHSGVDSTTVFKNVEKPYGIPYGCLAVKGFTNMLVAGRTIWCDRRLQASVRVMPNCFTTGEAAGIAASLAIDSTNDIHTISTDTLREKLLSHGAYFN